MEQEFESRMEWYQRLDEIYGSENQIVDDFAKADDGCYHTFYRTKQWTRHFVYNPVSRLGEF